MNTLLVVIGNKGYQLEQFESARNEAIALLKGMITGRVKFFPFGVNESFATLDDCLKNLETLGRLPEIIKTAAKNGAAYLPPCCIKIIERYSSLLQQPATKIQYRPDELI
ncbi:hypothetical protein J4209_02170 [Candidatus Woesearchaeota archaeon]|nr:hypothetical protein [Candidatus Woesearchaeota archaeon]